MLARDINSFLFWDGYVTPKIPGRGTHRLGQPENTERGTAPVATGDNEASINTGQRIGYNGGGIGLPFAPDFGHINPACLDQPVNQWAQPQRSNQNNGFSRRSCSVQLRL